MKFPSHISHLYHVTTPEKLASIRSAGFLKAGTYVADEDIAAYYADVIADDLADEEPVTLKIPVSHFENLDLGIDYPGLSEPVTFSTKGVRGEVAYQMWLDSEQTIESSFDIIGSIQVLSNIKFHEWMISYK